MSRRVVLISLVVILLTGFALRVNAVRLNWFMHADVIGDSFVTASVYRDGQFLVFPSIGSADPADYVLPPPSEGEPLKLHGPLVPVVAAGIMYFTPGPSDYQRAFTALRIVSLLSGMLILLFSFLIASRLLNPKAGLVVAAWVAASYVLIDYSGNGSIYVLQSALSLAWLYVAMLDAFPSQGRYAGWGRALLLGIIAGLGYLANYQCVMLFPAGVVLLAFQRTSWRQWLVLTGIFLGVGFLIALPWLIRSQIVFGHPLYGHIYNMGYPYGKAGLLVAEEDLGNVSFFDKLGVLHAVVTLWGPNNLYYAARKLFVITPIVFFLFSYGLIDIIFSRKRFKRAFPILVLLVLYMAMYAGWPIWKFRFFLPVLPIVFILAAEELWHLPLSVLQRKVVAGISLVAIMGISVLTYRAIPTHTTYFDGALTQDPFHSSEELTYLRKVHLLPAADAQ